MVPASVAFSVFAVCVSALVAFRWHLAHEKKALEHRPLVELQAKMNELENRLTANAFKR